MTPATPWHEIRDRKIAGIENYDELRREANVELAIEHLTYSLAELRRHRQMTQVELAEAMSVAQPTISSIERGTPEVETLRRYVTALGGRLEIIAVFDDGAHRIPLSA